MFMIALLPWLGLQLYCCVLSFRDLNACLHSEKENTHTQQVAGWLLYWCSVFLFTTVSSAVSWVFFFLPFLDEIQCLVFLALVRHFRDKWIGLFPVVYALSLPLLDQGKVMFQNGVDSLHTVSGCHQTLQVLTWVGIPHLQAQAQKPADKRE